MKAIIVFYDSLNKEYLPPYGNTEVIAPNFKRLQEKSITFNNSYVGSMPCVPARREIHTGRHNFLHREWGPLEPFDDSMPEILRNSGVYTHLISDHFHYWEDGGGNYHNRYSSWEIVRGQQGDHWKGEVKDPEIPEVVRAPKKQTGTGTSGLWRYDWVNRKYIQNKEDFPQAQVFDLGCEFIKTNYKEDDWVLHIETFDPHEPFYAPKEFLDLYKSDYKGKHHDWPRGQVVEDVQEVEHVNNQYKALVSMCDYNLGKVLDLMDDYSMWEDTMLIVCTDHGFLLGEHDWWGKNLMPYYNEIANTPLFIWDPRSRIQNERRNSMVQFIDFAPTLLEYFGQEIPKDMMGKSLSNLIKKDEPVRDQLLYGVFSGHVNIYDGRYTYMRAPLMEKRDEVYNYTLMPMHMNNRFTPEELQQMELVEPFDFSKECKVLKIKSKDKYGVAPYGNLLFDTLIDPKQQNPIVNEAVEIRMIKELSKEMKKCDAPYEQWIRLGIEEYYE